MDVSAIQGLELTSVEFVRDHLRLCFDTPSFTLYAWPHVLFPDFSLAHGEPEYRNGLCSLIGESVTKASCEEFEALTIEFDTGTVIALSLREEDLEGPQSGNYSETGASTDEEEF
jgi:hypothetical protein